MALKVLSSVEDGLGTVAKAIVATTAEDWKHLQTIVQRATNLWPDAPPEVKILADVVTVGVVQQDYPGQATDQRKKKNLPPTPATL